MYQTSIHKIEQDLKDLKRKFQCGTQFFETAEEFPQVGKECAIYVDKSTGAFYVYDKDTGTYISADTGDTTELSGAGVNEQVTYWTGASTLGGDGEFTYNSTTNLLSSGNLQLTNLQPATVDTDKFLVSDLGTLKTRTGAEILSDIGGVGGTGTSGQVAYWNGTTTQTGSSAFVYDAVNQRVGVNRTPIVTLDIATTFNTTITPLNSVPNVATSVLIGNTATNSVLAIGQNNTLQSWLQARSRLANQAANTLLLNPLGGDVLINNTDGTGRLTVRGSGTTSATTALLVQNSTPTELFKVLDNGAWNFNGDGIIKGSGNTSGTTALSIQNSSSAQLLSISNDAANTSLELTGSNYSRLRLNQTTANRNFGLATFGTSVEFASGTAITNYVFLNAGGFGLMKINTAILPTIGGNVVEIPRITSSFQPTSGSANATMLIVSPIINQTGGANGITRGLYVIPTLTAAADWRGIEITTSTVNTVVLGKNTGSAAVEITSTTQGFLPPRMTTAERDLITASAAGLVIFNTTTTKLECYDGAAWQAAW